jgi:DNA-directed RNA polymerase specialized sigma24 family protein
MLMKKTRNNFIKTKGNKMYELKRKLQLTKEQEALVRNKVLSLPKRERVIVILYFWEQYSHRQIARYLRIPIDAVPRKIQKAMDIIRRDLFDIAGVYFETYAPKKHNNYYGV